MTDQELEDLLKTHLECQDQLFLVAKLKNKRAVALVKKFKKFLVHHPDEVCSNVLDITHFSSLTRIRLIRNLTAAVNKKYNDFRTFFPRGDDPVFTLMFKFHKRVFLIELRPTNNQPGNAVIMPGDVHSYVLNNFENHGGCPQTVKDSLLESREDSSIVAPVDSHNDLNLNALNLVLDFEVARRLQESNPPNEWDRIPVASAVAGSLYLDDADKFFKMSFRANGPYRGDDPNSRKAAVKDFVRELFLTKGIKTSDDVNEMYTTVFGVDEAQPPVTPLLTPPPNGTAEPPVVIETQQTADDDKTVDEIATKLEKI